MSNTLQITSPAFKNNEFIPAVYTCDGSDFNPELNISGAPAGAKSLALIVDDPDSPSRNWSHWLVWNIAPSASKIAAQSAPPGARQGTTDFGDARYGGPCPHQGTHRYQFKLFALDAVLDLPATTTKKELEAAIAGHILDQATLVGLYKRI